MLVSSNHSNESSNVPEEVTAYRTALKYKGLSLTPGRKVLQVIFIYSMSSEICDINHSPFSFCHVEV